MLKSGDGNVYFGSASTKLIYRYDEDAFDDVGVPFDYEMQTKDYDMGSPIHLKKFKRVWVRTNQELESNTTYDVLIKIDYATLEYIEADGSESLVWDKGSWGENKWGWIDTVTRAFKSNRKGLRCSINLKGTSNATNLNRLFLFGVAFMYKAKKPYKEREEA
jgi:hypothetical protein